MPSKLEPEFGQRRLAPEASGAEAPKPRTVRIDRPREVAVPPVTKRAEAPRLPRAATATAAATAESFDDDDLEIPAFLRRRAN